MRAYYGEDAYVLLEENGSIGLCVKYGYGQTLCEVLAQMIQRVKTFGWLSRYEERQNPTSSRQTQTYSLAFMSLIHQTTLAFNQLIFHNARHDHKSSLASNVEI